MKILYGCYYITELSKDGLELSFEFESCHTDVSNFLLDKLISYYASKNVTFHSFYFESPGYTCVCSNSKGKKFSEPLDLSVLSLSDSELNFLRLDFVFDI